MVKPPERSLVVPYSKETVVERPLGFTVAARSADVLRAVAGSVVTNGVVADGVVNERIDPEEVPYEFVAEIRK